VQRVARRSLEVAARHGAQRDGVVLKGRVFLAPHFSEGNGGGNLVAGIGRRAKNALQGALGR
jgi:hypothetical protein